MFAEGKIFCPHCGQAEIIKFRMTIIRYDTDHSPDYRRLTVGVEAGYVTHNCPADGPAIPLKKMWS